jgi:hypothetical protein
MFDEQAALAVNPFEGDFGAPGDTILKNRVVTARKAGACQDCDGGITPGTRVRVLAAVFDGQLMSYRWCALCCAAMAALRDDDEDGGGNGND